MTCPTEYACGYAGRAGSGDGRRLGVLVAVRRWSDRLFAAYVPDGIFGRFVGTAASREEAQDLVVQALDSAASGRNMRPSGGSAHHAQTAGRHDPEG